MNLDADSVFLRPKRVDLHCHSSASTEADEAVLNVISCPESYSQPGDVYAQAKRRGMDFVTISDHDSIAGVWQLLDRPDVLTGEEVTCYFPEDHCKIHLLVWGLSPDDHDALQKVAQDIYQVAQCVQDRRLAHSVAHPVYRQNDRLERWHLERLILLFKGFECLNGAHSPLHRQSFEPMLDELTADGIVRLASRHSLSPLWPEPWIKARTGGSDDHGLFNIGRTYTEFPQETHDPADLLECLRTAHCRPGGEAGSSLKLAHNFFGVASRYHLARKNGSDASASSLMLKAMVGLAPRRRRDWVKLAVRQKAFAAWRRFRRPFARRRQPSGGSALLLNLLKIAAKHRIPQSPEILAALKNGSAVLEHDAAFSLVCQINRDVAAGIAASIENSVAGGQIAEIFDSLSAIALQQFLQMPYYFALFHQNRERHLLPSITGHGPTLDAGTMRLGIFTDFLDEANQVSAFTHEILRRADVAGREILVATCTNHPRVKIEGRKNFSPLAAWDLEGDPALRLAIPPVAEILHWADQQQFDAIHVPSFGPMGLMGLLVGKMLRVPVMGTALVDSAASTRLLSGGDHRLATAAAAYERWFYGQTTGVWGASNHARSILCEMDIPSRKIHWLPPTYDPLRFAPAEGDAEFWKNLGVEQSYRLIYRDRLGLEKNVHLLAESFATLCRRRKDVALIVAGDGPELAKLKNRLEGLPVYFLDPLDESRIARLYANGDLLICPSEVEMLGQWIIKAQASGLPAIVAERGAARQWVDDRLTGRVMASNNPEAWAATIDELLNDEPARRRMSRTAIQRAARFGSCRGFDNFWTGHLAAAQACRRRQKPPATPPSANAAANLEALAAS